VPFPATSTALVPMSHRLGGPMGKSFSSADPFTASGSEALRTGYDDMDRRSLYDRDRDYYDRDYDRDYEYDTWAAAPMARSRRNSAVSYRSVHSTGRGLVSGIADVFRSGHRIKFKRKGALMGGIGLDEAQARVRLSNNDGYTYSDLHCDHHMRILLKVKVSIRSSFRIVCC